MRPQLTDAYTKQQCLKMMGIKNTFPNTEKMFKSYGNLSKNTDKVIGVLKEMNIAYRALPPNNWTDSATIKDRKRSETSMIDIFERCCGKNLFTIMFLVK